MFKYINKQKQGKMKKICLLLIALLVLLPNALSQGDEIYYSTYLVLDSDVESSIEVIREGGASIDYVKAELYFFPKNDERQSVIDITSQPDAEPSKDKFVFYWDSPSEDILKYRVSSTIKVENIFEKVYNKINFPLEDELPLDVAEYINPTAKIDSGDRDIVNLANSIAEGEDDLFIVIHKIARWVKENIDYSLSTVTAEATQKASWVLENREGVCDELTALFMAMSRALGIPSRFISGIAYTDDPQFPEKWGFHGWAEVYLPGYGWVPFDVTYDELGWIDPSHIKLYESIDPDKPSTRIEWRGRNFDVKGGKASAAVEIKETGGRILDTVDISARALKKDVGFGSYNLIEAEVKNLRDYYVTTDISLASTENIELADGRRSRQIILKPGESKSVFWIIRVSPGLDREYKYTFPVLAYNQRNTTDRTEFSAEYKGTSYSYDEMEGLLESLSEEEEKEYSRMVEIDCVPEKDEFYEYEQNSIECTVENKGNTVIGGLDVCLYNECKSIDITIAQKKEVSLGISNIYAGERDLPVVARNAGISETEYVPVTILDMPEVSFEDLEHPAEMEYDGKGSITFTIVKESFSSLYNAKIRVTSSRIRHEWKISELEETRKFRLDFNANDLAEGENEFSIIAEFEDKNGRKYSAEKEFRIKLTGLTFFQKVIAKAKGIGFFIMNMF